MKHAITLDRVFDYVCSKYKDLSCIIDLLDVHDGNRNEIFTNSNF